MSYGDINPSTGCSWPTRIHDKDEKFLGIIGKTIVELIKINNGNYIGTYNDILVAAKLDSSFYGDLYNEIKDIKSKYGITSRKAGPRGATYTLSFNASGSVEENSGLLHQIESLVNTKPLDTLSKNEAVSLLKVIRLMLSD